MPIPFLVPIIIGTGSAILTAVGAKKAYDGYSDISNAKERGEEAEKRHRAAVSKVDLVRDITNKKASYFGEFKAKIVNSTMKNVLEFIIKIEKKTKSRSIHALEEVGISREDFSMFRANVLEAQTVFGAGYAAAMAGAAAGKAAFVSAGLFGTAGTGAAIGGLYGAAAKSATLAWLGGGSLAAGGGGMALGTAVLGGAVVGPAVFVTGFMLASEGEKAQTQVREYEQNVNIACEECVTITQLLNQIQTRMDELWGIVTKLDKRVCETLSKLNADTWNENSDRDIRHFQELMLLSRALVEVLRAPVLDEKGQLAAESSNFLFKYHKLLS